MNTVCLSDYSKCREEIREVVDISFVCFKSQSHDSKIMTFLKKTAEEMFYFRVPL